MDIVPYYGEQQLTASALLVRVNPDDRERINALCKRTSQLNEVIEQEDFVMARRFAAELKAMSNEIADSKRSAKRPFEAVLGAIESLAKEVNAPVAKEQQRILEQLNAYVEHLEELKRESERRRAEEAKAQKAAYERKIQEIEYAKAKAEALAKAANTAVEAERAKTEAAYRDLALAQAQLDRQLDMEIAQMSQEPPKGLVDGGRVDHRYKFKLLNAEQTVKAGCIRLLRVELNILNCQDSCRAQLEINPDKEPELPGIQVTKHTSVSVKAASRIA
jgi:hypothetical protein